MSNRIVAIALLLLSVATNSRADEIDDALMENGAYADAIRALSENKHEVAAIKLRAVAKIELTKAARLRVLTRIAEAELRGDNFTAVLALFSEPANTGLATDPQAMYWQALALIGSNRHGEAERILAEITASPENPHWIDATLTRSTLLLRFQQPEEAVEILKPLIGSGHQPGASRGRLLAAEIRLGQQRWDQVAELLTEFDSADDLATLQLRYLQARLSLGQQQWAEALAKFRPLSSPETLRKMPPNMRDGVTIGLAAALRGDGDTNGANAILRNFITTNPQSPNLIAAFESLDELGVFSAATLDEQLIAWSNSPPDQPLAAIATYFLANAQLAAVDEDTAAATLEAFRTTYSGHPIAERALLLLCEIYVGYPNKPKALAVLEDLREISKTPAVLARIDFIEAKANFAAGDFKLAADKFATAADGDQPATPAATFNSAIAELKANDLEAFKRRRQGLVALGEPALGADLQLERALLSARLESPEAEDELTSFLSQHPNHARRAEAHLALAYLYLLTPKIVSARKQLELAKAAPLLQRLAEEVDYVAFWIEHVAFLTEPSEANNRAVIDAGESFVLGHADSARAPEIMFKLGGIYFRDGSFAAAQEKFKKLAIDYPGSPRAEIALFTAGRAAMRSGTPASLDHATELFNRVAELGGQFAMSARLQTALIKHIQLKEVEAIGILQKIMDDKPEGDIRFSTLVAKGEAHSALGENDPEQLQLAIDTFRQISNDRQANLFWLNQSLTRIGNCHERAGRTDEALVAYEKVINRPLPRLRENEHADYVWYFKAGFAAMYIYEERENWRSALSIAEKLAATEGPRADLARKRSEQIATEHFIWRD